MQSTVTISAVGLAGIFLFGFLAGWMCARRIKGKFGISLQRQDAGTGLVPKFVFEQTKTIRTRTMSLKCQCGETGRFHETSGHPDQGSQPTHTRRLVLVPEVRTNDRST